VSPSPKDRWEEVERLFDQAIALPLGERDAYAREACGDDDDLYGRLTELLNSQADAFGYFEELGREISSVAPLEVEAERLRGERIGPYRLVRPLGEGGMGVVFLATRADGEFEHQVAIKLLRRDHQSETTVRRFLKERQILAGLSHSSIARLLDGGVAEDGRPYFVMEYVEGLSVLEYCDANRLTIEDRLTLFCEIADAVAYAHQALVVHRDLKPGNILVTAEGEVKLLDFGIAKLLDFEDDPSVDEVTRTQAVVLTPAYAAPEQIAGHRATTATDVYALGLLLYELMTGQRCHPAEWTSAVDFERGIPGFEPVPPSGLVSASDSQKVAQWRQVPAQRLIRKLSGDIDNICLMALERDPTRRYRSVDQMADDVRDHLAGRPVRARKQTVWYRAQKFVARHRVSLAVGVAFLALALGSLVSTQRQARRLAVERDKAESVIDLFVDVLGISDPTAPVDDDVTARELLDGAAVRIEEELAGQPEVQATLLALVGRVYRSFGSYPEAEPLLRNALVTRRELLGENHPMVLESAEHLGALLHDRGEYEEAEKILRDALGEMPERRQSFESLGAMSWLGRVVVRLGRYDEADAIFRSVLEKRSAELGADHKDVLESTADLAMLTYARGDWVEAESRLRTVLESERRLYGETHAKIASTLNNLASALARQGRHEDAADAQREALSIRREALGPEHPAVGTSLNNLGSLLLQSGDADGAEGLLADALELRRRVLQPDHPDVAQTLSNRGLALQQLGRLDEAERQHAEALEIRRRAYGEEHMLVAHTLNNLGLLQQLRGDLGSAEESLELAVELLARAKGPGHPFVANGHNNLGAVLRDRGDVARAEEHYRQALTIRRDALPPEHLHTAYTLVGLGQVLLDGGDAPAALMMLEEGLAIREKGLPAGSWMIAEAESALGACLSTLGRFEESEPLLESAYKTLRSALGDEHPLTLVADERRK